MGGKTSKIKSLFTRKHKSRAVDNVNINTTMRSTENPPFVYAADLTSKFPMRNFQVFHNTESFTPSFGGEAIFYSRSNDKPILNSDIVCTFKDVKDQTAQSFTDLSTSSGIKVKKPKKKSDKAFGCRLKYFKAPAFHTYRDTPPDYYKSETSESDDNQS